MIKCTAGFTSKRAAIMEKEVFVFEVSEKSFNSAVLLNSNKLPVVVEFMGVWSEPCVVQADIFSLLANEFAGQFIFARVDIDENPGLSRQYKIENVPTVLVFKNAELVRTEVGQLAEAEARSLLKDLGVFRQSDEMRNQAREKHLAGDTPGAVLLLTEAIKADPSNVRVVLDMVQIFIDTDQLDEAKGLFSRLPKSVHESETGRAITGQLLFKDLASKTEGEEKLREKLLQVPDDHAARFDLAVCMVADYQYREAMDALFQILQADANFREGAAREMIITLLNMLSPVNPQLAQEYRRKLGNFMAG